MHAWRRALALVLVALLVWALARASRLEGEVRTLTMRSNGVLHRLSATERNVQRLSRQLHELQGQLNR